MAKDISANVELEGGSIEVTPSLSDLTLAADADIHNVVAVKVQSDWNEIDDTSASYVRNKPAIKSGTGAGSIIEGYITGDRANVASGKYAHAEGEYTTASVQAAHAEGVTTTASNRASHAEGAQTTASGPASHAEGYKCVSEGGYAHSEGQHAKAKAHISHAEGISTIASSLAQHVQGQYNIEDANDTYAHIVGNGTSSERSNAHTLDWNGNAWYSGKVTADGTPTNDNDLVTKKWVEDKGYLTEQAQSNWTEEDNTSASYIQNKPNIASGTGTGSVIENVIFGNIANGDYSHAEGMVTEASGSYSHAEGSNTTASGNYSHAEGFATSASGVFSHAEGTRTKSSGGASHSEGLDTIASGNCSHAESSGTKANGYASHSEGILTIASSTAQHVQGQYNIEDSNNTYAHIVGNGTSSERSNAHTLDWYGNAWYSGKVTADGTPVNDNDLVSKKWVEDKGYLTQHQDISSKADKSEIPTKVSDLSNDSEFINGLTELEYGVSTWAEFTAARNAKKIVYCRCPMSGNSYRYAFLAYVSNTNVEFQYYRSVNAHTASQMGDQVFVYTLSSNGTWTTTTREASPKVIAGTGLNSSYTKDKLTLSIKSDYPTKAEVSAMIAEALAAYANGNA